MTELCHITIGMKPPWYRRLWHHLGGAPFHANIVIEKETTRADAVQLGRMILEKDADVLAVKVFGEGWEQKIAKEGIYIL